MRINILLEKLIYVAKKSKTDFAIHMNLVPSGLSKILAGTRLPSIKDRMTFTRHAADYFSEAIYSRDCHIKLKSIFPVIYEFKTRNNFHAFLVDAITLALDLSYASENGLDLNYADDRGMYYTGSRMVMHQLCIALSDCVIDSTDEPLEVFVSFPLSDNAYTKMFKDMIWFNTETPTKPVINYFFDPTLMNDLSNSNKNSFFQFIANSQNHFDLNLYKARVKPEIFLLVKGKLLLLLYLQDGNNTPVLIPTYSKSHINIFYNKIINGGSEKISYSRSEAIDLLEKNPQLVDLLINRGIDSVYNFTSIGYLLTRQDFNAAQYNPVICDAMLKLFSAVLTGKTTLLNISVNAMENFSVHGNLVIPLIGIMTLPPEKRTAYMKRFDEYLSGDYYSKVKILSGELSNIAMIYSQDMCLIYTVDDTSGREKFHILENMAFNMQMHEETHTTIELTSDIWSIYLNKLINDSN